jgi:hypothetical protein
VKLRLFILSFKSLQFSSGYHRTIIGTIKVEGVFGYSKRIGPLLRLETPVLIITFSHFRYSFRDLYRY